MKSKIPVAIVGATGMVGKCFAQLLENHPWFQVVAVAASSRSAGKSYGECVQEKDWVRQLSIPQKVLELTVLDATDIPALLASGARIVFSAIALDKTATAELETAYAKAGLFVVSNNSAHRGTPDVPMIIPELNHNHLKILFAQRKRLGTETGGIVVKPNCSLMSYVPLLAPLLDFGIQRVFVCTYQAASGAGRILTEWPKLLGNVIPYIDGEEQKSEQEPLKIFGTVGESEIERNTSLRINATCIRVPVQHGHVAATYVIFEQLPTLDDILHKWSSWQPLPQQLELPSAPVPFINILTEVDRPQPRLDVSAGNCMAISVGLMLMTDRTLRFAGFSHNLVRGAAGGSVLTAELCIHQRYA